jgi:hypothetical protein
MLRYIYVCLAVILVVALPATARADTWLELKPLDNPEITEFARKFFFEDWVESDYIRWWSQDDQGYAFTPERYVVYGKFDLNGDGVAEVFLSLASIRECGTDGCRVLVLQRRNHRWRVICETFGHHNIRIYDKKSGGFRNIGVDQGMWRYGECIDEQQVFGQQANYDSIWRERIKAGGSRFPADGGPLGANRGPALAGDVRETAPVQRAQPEPAAPRKRKKDDDGYGNYDPRTGRMGRYGVTPAMLDDIGWRCTADGKWTDTARQHRVRSDKDFLRRPEAQEAAFTLILDRLELVAEANGLFAYIGRSYLGPSPELKEPIKVSKSGIIGALHRPGLAATKQFLEKMEAIGWNSYRMVWDAGDKEAERRIRAMTAVDYGGSDQPPADIWRTERNPCHP